MDLFFFQKLRSPHLHDFVRRKNGDMSERSSDSPLRSQAAEAPTRRTGTLPLLIQVRHVDQKTRLH